MLWGLRRWLLQPVLHDLHSGFRDNQELQMALADDIKALISKVDDATNAVASRITILIAKITPQISDADVTAIKAGLQAEVDKLTALGSDQSNPVPTP